MHAACAVPGAPSPAGFRRPAAPQGTATQKNARCICSARSAQPSRAPPSCCTTGHRHHGGDLGRRCAPAAAWSPVGVYKGPGGPHHAAGSAPCGHAALLVPSSHGSANCQPPLKVTVDRLSAQQNSPKSQETQASVCPTRHRFNRAKTRRWHGVMLIHLWDGAIDQRGGTLVVVYVLVCGVPSESRPGTWNTKKNS